MLALIASGERERWMKGESTGERNLPGNHSLISMTALEVRAGITIRK